MKTLLIDCSFFKCQESNALKKIFFLSSDNYINITLTRHNQERHLPHVISGYSYTMLLLYTASLTVHKNECLRIILQITKNMLRTKNKIYIYFAFANTFYSFCVVF